MPNVSFDRTLLSRLQKRYPHKIVAFDSEFGVICTSTDTNEALAYAQRNGFGKPFLYDTSLNKLIDLGYTPQSPFLNSTEV
jgi:hypothetical protein